MTELTQIDMGTSVWIQGDYKLHKTVDANGNTAYQLYGLTTDPYETNNLAKREPEQVQARQTALHAWQSSVWQDYSD